MVAPRAASHGKLLRETGASSIVVRINRGLLTCALKTDGLTSVDMGKPLWVWRDVPIAWEADTLWLPLPDAPAACTMGNPHCTFFVDDAEAVPVETLGPGIKPHPMFPSKTKVHFVHVVSPARIRLRIWERGGGVPLGSGSCSCGAVVNGTCRGFQGDVVDVECAGGSVRVKWDGAEPVFLTRQVEARFRGFVSWL